MKKFIAIAFVLFFLFANCNFSEKKEKISYIQDLMETEKVYLLDTNLDKIDKIHAKIINDNVYLIYNHQERKDDFVLYHLYEFSDKKRKYSIFINESLIDERNWIYDFYLRNDTLILMLYKSIIICKKEKEDFYAIKKINLKLPSHYIDFYNGNYNFYYSGALNQRFGRIKKLTHKITYDSNFKDDSIYHYELPSGLIWTFIRPRKLIAFYNDLLLVSDADNYHLRIYDKNNNIIWDTTLYQRIIHNRKFNWDTGSFDELIEGIQHFPLIRSVDFLDTNRVLVVWTHPKKQDNKHGFYTILFDIWNKSNGKWSLEIDSLKNIDKGKEKLYNYCNEILDRFSVSNTKIVSIHPIPFKIPKNSKLTNYAVDSLAKEYIYNNQNIRYSIIVRKIK
jgi:hypothetical protein